MKHLLFATLILLAVSCQKETEPPPGKPQSIELQNAGFEAGMAGWTIEADPSWFGFMVDTSARTSGLLGLNFYAAQKHHWEGAPQETPWNGKITQTVNGLKNGSYTLTAMAGAVGDGMYLTGNGINVKIKSESMELNKVDFEVTDGKAVIGFICIKAGGAQEYAPYFHADDVTLTKN